MPDAIEIIDRLKNTLRAGSDSELARRLGVPQTTVSAWRQRGRIPPGAIARIAVAIGRSVEWVKTGSLSQIEAATRVAEELDSTQGIPLELRQRISWLKPLAEAVESFQDADADAIELLVTLLPYIRMATHVERETIRRLLRGLRASPEVRTHLVGQLKLIERLIEAEQPPREDEIADPPSRAKAS